ncbi:12322_t:CDS:2, partial [Racocetra persica]
ESQQDEIQQNDVITRASCSYIGNTEINEDSSYTANKETGEPENRFTKDDPIYKLFQRVFVNDSWSCASSIEKPTIRQESSPSERPFCARCGGKSLPKKRYKWSP